MAYVDLQTFQRDPDRKWSLVANGPLEISLVDAVMAASLASPPPPDGERGDAHWPLHEIGLLVDYFTLDEAGPLRWKPAWRAAPPHFRHYLTQSAAIAITVDLARMYGWDPAAGHSLFWFDDLPKDVSPEVSAMMPGGPFPDVLCQIPDGWISLESRGRTSPAPVKPPNGTQTKRLAQLDGWARNASTQLGYEPMWGMGWTSFSRDDSRVDFFDPGEPVTFSPETVQQLDAYRQTIEARFAFSVFDAATESALSDRRQYDLGYALTVGEEEVPAVIRFADASRDVGADPLVVGIARAPLGRRVRDRRPPQAFEVAQYGSLLFFAGPVGSGYPTEQRISELIDAELD